MPYSIPRHVKDEMDALYKGISRCRRNREILQKERIEEQQSYLQNISHLWKYFCRKKKYSRIEEAKFYKAIEEFSLLVRKLPASEKRFQRKLEDINNTIFYYEKQLIKWELERTLYIDPDL